MKAIKLDELKKIQLNILQDFSAFCEENGLTYFLAYGTLIGAIRHNGYIPWDDDIDLVMPRKDYEIVLFEYNKRDSVYKIGSIYNHDDYQFSHIKVGDTRTLLIDGGLKSVVNIDVFPLDGLSNSRINRYKQLELCKILRLAVAYKRLHKNENHHWLKKFLIVVIKVVLTPFSIHFLIKKLDRIAKKYPLETSSEAINIVWGVYGKKEILKKTFFKSGMLRKFENSQFKVPLAYDKILTNLYGKYMVMPPLHKRKTHHQFKAYWLEN